MSKIKINSPYNGGMFGGWNWVDYGMIPTCVRHHQQKDRQAGQVGLQPEGRFHLRSMDAMQTAYKVGMKLDGTITAVWVKTYFENMAIEAAGHLFEEHAHPQHSLGDRPRPGEQGPTHALQMQATAGLFLPHPRLQPRCRSELGLKPTEVA